MIILPLGGKNLWLLFVHTAIIVGALTVLHVILEMTMSNGYSPVAFIMAVILANILSVFFSENSRNIWHGSWDEVKAIFERDLHPRKKQASERLDKKYPRNKDLDDNPLL